jgi:predicted PurR-regulated permease PerM
MLHRPTSAPVWSPLRWLGDRRAALTGPISGLLRYVIIAALLTAIGIVYLWQVNSLSNTYEATLKLEQRARDLEQQNWLLAEQLAQWSSPAYVDRLSAEQGYVAASVTTLSDPMIASVQPNSAAAGQ